MKQNIITLILVALIAAISVWAKQLDSARAKQGRQAHTALCVLEQDLKRKINDGQDFLADHPRGIPGIPPAVIRNSIKNEQGTVDALRKSGLTCD